MVSLAAPIRRPSKLPLFQKTEAAVNTLNGYAMAAITAAPKFPIMEQTMYANREERVRGVDRMKMSLANLAPSFGNEPGILFLESSFIR